MLSGKLLPIHFKPQPNELLSSWLVRLSIAHGMKPYIFWNMILGRENFWRKSKVDQTDDKELLTLISEKTGTSYERLLSTTLAAYTGYLYEKSLTHGFSTWIMPQGVVRRVRQKLFGLQFCPLCLAEDKEPFFRRNWRLAFVVFCEKHNVVLLDRCTHCNEAVNFYMNVSREPVKGLLSYTICHNCKRDLRHVNSESLRYVQDSKGIEFQEFLIKGLNQGWVEVPQSGYVHSYLFFYGLYCLMSGLIRNLPKIQCFPDELSQCNEIKKDISISPQAVTTFERLDIKKRSSLMGILHYLLINWPDGFTGFCKANGLWSGTWSRGREFVPFWCRHVIDEHLDRSKYIPSEQEIDAAIDYICKTGNEPNGDTLSKYFGKGYCEKILRRRELVYRNKVNSKCPHCHATRHQYQYGLTKRDSHLKIKCRECKRKYTRGLIQRGYPPQLRQKAVQLYAQGFSVERIVQRLSVSRAAIYTWIKAY